MRPTPLSSRRRLAAVGIALALVVAACDSGDDDGASVTTAPPATSRPARASDGVLRIGVLLPRTGVASQLGAGMSDAIVLARDRINAAGGVLGRNVEIVDADEGDDETTAASGIDTLLQAGVDAIVGPASSLVALAALDATVGAGVVTCSPTATAIALDDYPDEGLFFRTTPSDSLQAEAIATVAEGTGARTIAVGHLDDPYGRAFADALADAVAEGDLELGEVVAVDGRDGQLVDDAAKLLAGDPGVVVVLGDADDGSRLVGALGDVLEGDDDPPTIIVNDSLRNPATQPVMQRLPAQVRAAVVGVAPAALNESDPGLAEPYAAQAYDCVNLIALAAAQAGTDEPGRIAQQIAPASVGGSACRDFQECIRALADGLQINYEGPSGNTDLSGRTGDPTTGRFEEFGFSAQGIDQVIDQLPGVTAD